MIFRLGRVRKGRALGPGLMILLPFIDSESRVDLRTIAFRIPSQEILSSDSVACTIDAVVYYKVIDPLASVCNVADAKMSVQLLASSTVRAVLATKSLTEILTDRINTADVISAEMDEYTKQWGIEVERVELRDVILPQHLQRAMAAEAEASREALAKVITAEGEQRASTVLKRAADGLSESPVALHLRYLQTLPAISAEKHSTIIFPCPMEMLGAFGNWMNKPAGAANGAAAGASASGAGDITIKTELD